jgi:hypothetical protein
MLLLPFCAWHFDLPESLCGKANGLRNGRPELVAGKRVERGRTEGSVQGRRLHHDDWLALR